MKNFLIYSNQKSSS